MDGPQIGVYGGTFDPVHIGHLAAVDRVREAVGLDRVLWVPNSRQPLKTEGPFATAAQRLRMLRVAVAGNPGFAVSTLELDAPGPSYTVDTLDRLQREQPTACLRFIMGTDAANGLGAWRSPERILRAYRPIVMVRAGWPLLDWAVIERIAPDARELVDVVEAPLLAIASRDLREAIARKQSVRYLLPDRVRALIAREGLYAAVSEP